MTVADVEARLALLQEKGLLLGDGDRMVTTQGAVRLEQAYLAAVEAGHRRSAPIVPAIDAAPRAQEAARDLGLRRLNPGQEAAAVLVLSSSDRVVNVQGGAGRGKSAALAPMQHRHQRFLSTPRHTYTHTCRLEIAHGWTWVTRQG